MSAIPANVLLGTSKEAAAYIQQIRTMRKDSPSFAKAADAQFLKQAYGWEDFRQGLGGTSPLSYGLAGAGGGGLLAAINELRRKKKHRNWWNVLKGMGIGGALGAGGAQLNEMFRPDGGPAAGPAAGSDAGSAAGSAAGSDAGSDAGDNEPPAASRNPFDTVLAQGNNILEWVTSINPEDAREPIDNAAERGAAAVRSTVAGGFGVEESEVPATLENFLKGVETAADKGSWLDKNVITHAQNVFDTAQEVGAGAMEHAPRTTGGLVVGRGIDAGQKAIRAAGGGMADWMAQRKHLTQAQLRAISERIKELTDPNLSHPNVSRLMEADATKPPAAPTAATPPVAPAAATPPAPTAAADEAINARVKVDMTSRGGPPEGVEGIVKGPPGAVPTKSGKPGTLIHFPGTGRTAPIPIDQITPISKPPAATVPPAAAVPPAATVPHSTSTLGRGRVGLNAAEADAAFQLANEDPKLLLKMLREKGLVGSSYEIAKRGKPWWNPLSPNSNHPLNVPESSVGAKIESPDLRRAVGALTGADSQVSILNKNWNIPEAAGRRFVSDNSHKVSTDDIPGGGKKSLPRRAGSRALRGMGWAGRKLPWITIPWDIWSHPSARPYTDPISEFLPTSQASTSD